MDSHFFCDDLNHSILSWNHLKFTASCSPEIVPGVSDTEAAKAATAKPAAESSWFGGLLAPFDRVQA